MKTGFFNADEFLQGQKDCQQGVPHKHGSDSYDRGYSAQYQHEQNLTEISLQVERLKGLNLLTALGGTKHSKRGSV